MARWAARKSLHREASRAASLGLLLLFRLTFAQAAAPFSVNTQELHPRLESQMGQALGRQVQMGAIKVSLLSGGLYASGLEIAEDTAFGREPFLRTPSVGIHLAVRPLLFGRKWNITGMTIDAAQLRLLQKADGTWNVSSLGRKPGILAKPQPDKAAPEKSTATDPIPSLLIRDIAAHDGIIVVEQEQGASYSLRDVQLQIHNFNTGASFPVALTASIAGGGNIALLGHAGPRPADPHESFPWQANVRVASWNLRESGVSKAGPAGLVSFQGDAGRNSGHLRIRGTMQATQWTGTASGRPNPLPLEGSIMWEQDAGGTASTLQGDFKYKQSNFSLTGTYGLDQTAGTHLSLYTSAFPIDDWREVLAAFAIALPAADSLSGGTSALTIKIDGKPGEITTSGMVLLKNTHLAGFEQSRQLRSLSTLTGVRIPPNAQFESIAFRVSSGPNGTRFDDIVMIAPGLGLLTGSGTIGTSHQLAFQMKASLRPTGGIIAIVNRSNKDTVIPFFVRGTTSNPKFIADMRGMAQGIAKQNTERMGRTAQDILGHLKPK